jgi:outer membrane protein assembly factor BamB
MNAWNVKLRIPCWRCGLVLMIGLLCAGDWPQFRGPNAAGKAVGAKPLPADISPDSHVLWQTPLPGGHSSPVIIGDRLYLTGIRDGATKELLTLCLDKQTGEILWEQEAPYAELEQVNVAVGSHAQSTCVANDQCVVSFFGSAGMFCYDPSGNFLWRKEFESFKNDDGAGSSPVLVGDRVIFNQDHDIDSFLMAIRITDGSTIWRTERPQFIRGYATPVIWDNDGNRQIVVAGSLMVKGYDLDSGVEKWSASGLSWGVVATPVIGDDGSLFVPSLAAGIVEVTDRASSFEEMDRDGNGVLSEEEFEFTDAMMGFFTHFDRDKDGEVVLSEYQSLRTYWENSRHVLLAIRPGGEGDITDTHVSWSTTRAVPTVPSPVFHENSLFVVKDGGVVSSVDANTGEVDRPRRMSGRGDYYCSPVVGDGKIYFLSQRGDLTVITAQSKWREIASARFDEEAFATPAIVDGRIYLRTASQLYCFGYTDPDREEAFQPMSARSWRLRILVIVLACGLGAMAIWRGSRMIRRK